MNTDLITPPLSFHLISTFVLLVHVVLLAVSFVRVKPLLRTLLSDRIKKFPFLIVSVALLLWTILVFPGFISMDDYVALDGIKDGQVTIWTSIVYGYLLSGFDWLGLTYGGPVILTALFYWVLIVQVFDCITISKKWTKPAVFLSVLLTVVLLWPVQLAYLSYHNRDSLYAVLIANLFFLLLNIRREPVRTLNLTEILIYAVIISTSRHEGLIIAALAIFWLIGSKAITIKAGLAMAFSFFIVVVINSYWSRQQIFWDRLAKQYQVIQYVTTLSAILNSPEANTETPAMRGLQKYYDFECLKNLKQNGWYNNARGRCLRSEGVENINFSYYGDLLGVYAENSSAVMEHYREKLKRTFNQSHLIQDIQSEAFSEDQKEVPDPASTKAAVFRYLQTYHSYPAQEAGPTFLIFSTLVAVIAVLYLNGAARWLLILFHLRIPVILLFSPDPQSKYYFTLCTLLPVSLVLIFNKYFFTPEDKK